VFKENKGLECIDSIKISSDWKNDVQMHIGDFYGDGTISYFFTEVQMSDNDGNPVSNASHSLLSDYTKNIPGDDISSLFINSSCKGIMIKDVNGDGLSDIIKLSTLLGGSYELYFKEGEFHCKNNGMWSLLYNLYGSSPPIFGDFNGDGKQDVLQQLSSIAQWKTYTNTNKENLLFGDNAIDMTFSNFSDSMMLVGDFNGDGRADIFVPKKGKIFFSNGTKNPIEYTLPNFTHQEGYVYQVGDFNGDGKDEFIYTHKDKPAMTLYQISPHEQRYLAQVIMDGFNRKTELEYKPLTNNNVYIKGTTTPTETGVVNFQAPLHVVSKMSVPNGVGGKTSVSFSYENAKVHKRGKGFLGFAKTTSVNTVNDLKTVNEYGYHTTFFNSYLKQTKTMLASNNSEIQKITHTNNIHDFGNKIILPYIEKTVKEDLLTSTKIVDSLKYDFANGNLTFHETLYVNITSGGGGGGRDVETTIYTETAKYYYEKRVSPPSPYECLLKKQETTGKHFDDGNKEYYRYINYGYDAKGNLKRTVTDNNVIAHYMIDSYGLATKKIDTIPDIGITVTDFEYDSNHRFVIKTTNSVLGTVQTNYNILGKLKNETDITNLTTSYKYNRLGRLIETHTPEGHIIKNSQQWTNSDPNAPQYALYYVNIEAPGRPSARTYYDILGRELRSRTINFDGKNVFVDKIYNAKGQLYQVSDPYFANDTKKYTTYEYDAYGRKNKIKYQ
jgi:YD repeat-containing protein